MQKTGTFAVLSILAAVGAFIVTFSGSPILGIILGLMAVPFGVFGLLRAASPKVSGGLLSIFGIVLGGTGVIVALLGAVGMIIF